MKHRPVILTITLKTQAEEEAGVKYERKWDAVWVRAQDIINEGILISPRMTSDHYTTTLMGALQARQLTSHLQRQTCCALPRTQPKPSAD